MDADHNRNRGRGGGNERVRAVEVRLDGVDKRLQELYPPVQEASADIKEVLSRMGMMEKITTSLAQMMEKEVVRSAEHENLVLVRLSTIETAWLEHGSTVRVLHTIGSVARACFKALAWIAAFGAGSVALYKFIVEWLLASRH